MEHAALLLVGVFIGLGLRTMLDHAVHFIHTMTS